MKKTVLYIHGKGGSAAESEHYGPLFPGCEVVGLDYQTATPWEAGDEIREAVKRLKNEFEDVILIAVSIGAYFSMNAGIDALLSKAYFISPIVDMERLICDGMSRAKVTEAQLERERVLSVDFGEALSWDYLCYVRTHTLRWKATTKILFGEKDQLVPYETVKAFAEEHNAALTVMKNGEHWFHTQEQLRFVDEWIKGDL